MTKRAEIVLIHGLWFHGIGMAILAGHLRRYGWQVRVFSYPTVSRSFAHNAQALYKFVTQSEASEIHFVGHSLGGLLTLRTLIEFDIKTPGKVVLLGTPLAGSHVARRVDQQSLLRPTLGRSAGVLCEGFSELHTMDFCRAGNRPVGIGRITGRLLDANDGTVLLKETYNPGLQGHTILPVTHTEMVVSGKVAKSASDFLQTGSFDLQK